MSLPQAQKEISAKPGPNSVVDPVNKTQKDADVDRKLRLYGVINAFREGRMPSNAQIDETLSYVLAHSPVDLDKLSPDGRTLIQDTREIIETAQTIVREKNADELFQNFIWNTRDVELDRAKKDPSEVMPVDKDKATADGKQAVQHLRTLLSLVLTNSEARKLLADFSLIGRDLLARGAVKASEMIAPDQERLARVDDAAPHDQFHTAGGRTIGPDEGTPVPEMRVPGTDTYVSQHPREPIGNVPTDLGQARDAFNDPSGVVGANATIRTGDGQVRSGADVMTDARDRGQGALNEYNERGPEMANQYGDRARQHVEDVTNATGGVPETEEEKEAGKRTFMDKMRSARDGLWDRVPDEHKDKVRGHRDRTREFFSEEYFPQERRDQFIYRGKKVILECQKHNDYQESIRWLIAYVEEYAGHGRTVAGHGKDAHQNLSQDPALNEAGRQLRTLLERFANGQSMDIIWDAANNLINDANNDEDLRNWFKEVDAYFRKTLLEPGYVLEPKCNDDANRLRDSGRRFYDEKYKGHFDNFFDSVGTFFKAMGDDPLNKRFGEDWARLTRDLLFDEHGSLQFKRHLWNDIRNVIVPTLVEQVGYIPIPRVEYTDHDMDVVIENLTLSGRNLFPNIVRFEAHNFVQFSPYKAIQDESAHEFTLTLGHIQADMRDVAFWFRKKSGFPKITDSGLADVVLGGEGMTVTVRLADAHGDNTSVFNIKDVHVKLDSLKFAIRDAKYELLYKTLRLLATGLIKKQIQRAIGDAIRTGLEYVDGQLVTVRDRMREAKLSDDTSRAQVLKQMFEHRQETSHDKDSAKRFSVVSKRDSVLLPGKGNPAGWVNRIAERDEKARQGETWQSPAFNIVGQGAGAGVHADAAGGAATANNGTAASKA